MFPVHQPPTRFGRDANHGVIRSSSLARSRRIYHRAAIVALSAPPLSHRRRECRTPRGTDGVLRTAALRVPDQGGTSRRTGTCLVTVNTVW